MTRRTYGSGYTGTKPVPIRLKTEQREAIEAAAAAADMPPSTWIREVALLAANRPDLTDYHRN